MSNVTLDEIEYPDAPTTFEIVDSNSVDDNISIKKIQIDGKTYISKVVTKIDPFVLIETSILATSNHKNIICLLDVVDGKKVKDGDDDTIFYLILPMMTYPLDDMILLENFSLERIQDYVHQIASGLHYLHENDIVHSDLKSRNIMVHRSKENIDTIKIIDFDSSEYLDNGVASVLIKCTTTYRPPEGFSFSSNCIVEDTLRCSTTEEYFRKYYKEFLITKKFDIWSFGIVIVELLTGIISYRNTIYPSFPGAAISSTDFHTLLLYEREIKNVILSEEFDRVFRRRLPEGLRRMLSIDPDDRISCEEILKYVNKWRGVVENPSMDMANKNNVEFLGLDEDYSRMLKIFKEYDFSTFENYPNMIKRATHHLLNKVKRIKSVEKLHSDTKKAIIKMCNEMIDNTMNLRDFFTIETELYDEIVKEIILMTKGKIFSS